MGGYLQTNTKSECFGCEACAQVCAKNAIRFEEDIYGFRYPIIDKNLCINCNLCINVCPQKKLMRKEESHEKYVFGGYNLDKNVRFESTSGGAFSAIVDSFCDDNYVIFGAEADGLKVFHSYIEDKNEISKFRKSKYSQSIIGDAYKNAKRYLLEGKKVLFSGTPCQISGLNSFLEKVDTTNLLTVEVICEGVPSPKYIEKYSAKLERKYGKSVEQIDYRYTGNSFFKNGKWDFEVMRVSLGDNKYKCSNISSNHKEIKIDRWFNPFWSVWLKHLMSRPSCYNCMFAKEERYSDITLGDLWGVHLYCPELYGKNGGASLVMSNTAKGKTVVKKAERNMYGHELVYSDALKYQSPLRKSIDDNTQKKEFMDDLISEMDYDSINKKWASKASLNLIWQKYVWGNRQKIMVWNMKRKIMKIKKLGR